MVIDLWDFIWDVFYHLWMGLSRFLILGFLPAKHLGNSGNLFDKWWLYGYIILYNDFFLGITLYTMWICRVESIKTLFSQWVFFHCLGNPPRKLSWSITFYDYPLVNVYIAKWKDSPSLSSVNQRTKWAIFNSYVKLPEGILEYGLLYGRYICTYLMRFKTNFELEAPACIYRTYITIYMVYHIYIHIYIHMYVCILSQPSPHVCWNTRLFWINRLFTYLPICILSPVHTPLCRNGHGCNVGPPVVMFVG